MTTAPQITIREIRRKEDLESLEMGEVILLVNTSRTNSEDKLARVLRSCHNERAVSGNHNYLYLVYRENQKEIVDGHILISESEPIGDGRINAYFTSYSLGRRGIATDFDKLDDFLREAGL